MKKNNYLLNFSKLDLLEQRKAKEDEIKSLFNTLTDVNRRKALLSGYDYWVNVYNRRITEYRAFCIARGLYVQNFTKLNGKKL